MADTNYDSVVATTFTGNLVGNSAGTHTGPVVGNITGGAFTGITEITGAGAVTIPTRDTKYVITAGSAIALTIANPTDVTHDGVTLTFIAAAAQAYTLSNAAGAGFNGAGAGGDVGTFGGAIGDGLQITAWNAVWHVNYLRNVTLG